METAGQTRLTATTVDRRIAGLFARVDIDGGVAPKLAAPFVDLAPWSAPRAPDLAIRLRPFDDGAPRALHPADLQPSGVMFASPDGRHVHHWQPHSSAVLDRVTSRIRASIRTCGEPATFTARPLHALLSIVCADRGIDLVHAALVSYRGHGVLIAGRGGAGKSTTAVAALLDGWDYLGDDCVAVAHRDGRFLGSRVFASACVEPAHLARFAPQLAIEIAAPGDKTFCRIRASGESDTAIRAIVVPRVTGGDDVVLRPLPAKAALLALAPTSILKRAVPPAAALARLRMLATACPCYMLEMGPPAAIGRRLRDIVEAPS